MGIFGSLFGSKPKGPNPNRGCKACWCNPAIGEWLCDQPSCRNYNEPFARRKAERAAEKRPADFSNAVEVQYVNHAGESKVFKADPKSIRIRKKHISLRVAPSGVRIALKPASITNREAVLGQIGR
jgi:hypothetical protein